MSKTLTMDYHLTAEAAQMTKYFIREKIAEKYPYFVKVHNIWHTEITERLRQWITDNGGTNETTYSTLTEFMFAEEHLCTMFIVRFRGVPVDDIYKR
jgi:hypothetical protein